MPDQNPGDTVRAAVHAFRETGATREQENTLIEAAEHYADFVVVLSELFTNDPTASLEIEVGNAVQAHIEQAVTRGGVHSVQELGHAALAPVLARLRQALNAGGDR